MTLDLLVTTMRQNDFSLVDLMNIKSNTLILNQCDHTSIETLTIGSDVITMVSTNTIGKSKNQNFGLLYSKADIILFSDDDLILTDNYKNIVIDFFTRFPKADAVKFYCESTNQDRPIAFKKPSKIKRVNKFQMMSAGTPMFAIKRKFLVDHGIFFNISFGPGTDCTSGEDSVFYDDLFKYHPRVYANPTLLAYVKQNDSCWFSDFDNRYFINSGMIYRKVYGPFSIFFIIRKALRFKKNKKTKLSFKSMVSLMWSPNRRDI